MRCNGNVLVLPLPLLDELSTLPAAIASPHGALEHDLLGKYTGLNVILENRLHHSIIQRKLTPNLGLITPTLEDTLITSFDKYFPKASEWVEFQPYQVFAKVAARLSAEAIVGPAFSENPIWLDLAVEYTDSCESSRARQFSSHTRLMSHLVFRTIVVLRFFPAWVHPLLCTVLPSYWRCQGYIKSAKSLLKPKIEELLEKDGSDSWEPQYDKEDMNVLTWLCSLAKGRDRTPDAIAHVQVLLALAAVHTTLLRMVNVLYDLTVAEAGLLEELQAEISDVAKDPNGWKHTSYDRLHKLDSVLRESQRMSPPTILGMKRLFKQNHTFQNGLHVPKGTYVCMPIYAIENDREHTPNPEAFDGLRSYRQFMEQAATGKKHVTGYKFSDPTPTVLSFGYGRTACPGRFFASLFIKMLFVKLLTEYDFQLLPGTERPPNMMVHEFLFTWPWQQMLVKRNNEGLCPFGQC